MVSEGDRDPQHRDASLDAGAKALTILKCRAALVAKGGRPDRPDLGMSTPTR